MTKKFVTTVTTEWEVRGDVAIDRINARLRMALGGMMMTAEEGPNYAFTGEKHLLELNTVEEKQTPNQETPSGLPKYQTDAVCLYCNASAVALNDTCSAGTAEIQWCEAGHVMVVSSDHRPDVQLVFDFSKGGKK